MTRWLAATVVLLVALLIAWLWLRPARPRQGQPQVPWAGVTISKETTFIEGPLDDEGCVDYLAALHGQCAEGVTPENNAAVLFWKAFGPAEIPEAMRPRFFAMLGIEPLPAEGEYLVTWDEYLASRQAAGESGEEASDDDSEPDDSDTNTWRQLDRASQRPWSPEEFPVLAECLEANRPALQLVVDASRRSRFYSPLLVQDSIHGRLLSALLLAGHREREAAKQLAARAMLRLHQGKVDQAWEDLLACHRAARLVGQGPTWVEALLALGIEGVACRADALLACPGNLTAEQAKRFLADLEALGPMPRIADKLDVGERYMYLDLVAAMSRGPAEVLESVGGRPDDVPGGEIGRQLGRAILNLAGATLVDWDEALRIGNRCYDRMVDAASRPTRAERCRAMDQLEAELDAMFDTTRDRLAAAKSFLKMRSPRTALGEHAANVFLAILLPAVQAALDSEDRGEAMLRLAVLAFALAAYHADHGRYPERLSDLSPGYLSRLPSDPFNEKAFRYECRQDGYLLYSVGPNGKDENGRNYRVDYYDVDPEDVPDDADRETDDVAIAVPAETS